MRRPFVWAVALGNNPDRADLESGRGATGCTDRMVKTRLAATSTEKIGVEWPNYGIR